MFKIAKPFFMICETPLHAGSGNDLGIVDMPIQRERHTDFPKIEGSSLKGAIREAFEELATVDLNNKRYTLTPKTAVELKNYLKPYNLEDDWKEKGKTESKEDKNKNKLIKFHEAISLTFGPENGDTHAGALGFTDARILLFPVKSMQGIFAWITCPKALKQFEKDLTLCENIVFDWVTPSDSTLPAVPVNCQLMIKNDKIILEEYTFNVKKDSDLSGICSKLANWLSKNLFPKKQNQKDIYSFWRGKLEKDIVILPNNDFKDFVTLSTEVITRTKIQADTGTVQPGALFTEEYLPAETILYSLALTTPVFNEDKSIFQAKLEEKEEDRVMNFFSKGLPEVIQLGGNATIGKGIVRTKVVEK